MTRKREKLVRSLSQLLAEHSSADWEYATKQLGMVAELARRLAFEVPSKPKPVRSKMGPKKPTRTSEPSQKNRNPMTQEFLDYLEGATPALNRGRIRELAILLGMKDDLPKTFHEMKQSIYNYLDNLEESARIHRVEKAIATLEKEHPGQENQYARWVTLITKKSIP